jgi:DNA-binding MarR family transcriptional regulator
LEERGLVKRLRDEQDHRLLQITDLAESSYFAASHVQELDVPLDDQQDDVGESGMP